MLEWLLGNQDVQLLLLFDVCLHGSVVAECLRCKHMEQKDVFDDWLRHNVVQASAPSFLLPYIERILYMNGCVCERKMQTPILTPTVKTYTFPDARLRVQLTYDTDGSTLNIPQARTVNNHSAAIDVHLLSLNRHALFSRQIDLRPIMLHHLQDRCYRGTFEILTPSAAKVEDVQKMIDDGWRRLGGVQCTTYVGGTDVRCTICQYGFEEGEQVACLPSCGHEFHINCWRRFRPEDDTFQFPPLCRVVVSCPVAGRKCTAHRPLFK